MTCPFKKGDTIRDKQTKARSIVTRVHHRGFDHRLLEPALIHPLIGSAVGGTIFPAGFECYELIAEAAITYSYRSNNSGMFYGRYDSREAAARDGMIHTELQSIEVGQNEEPISPEQLIDGNDIIEHILNSDEYTGDYVDWPGASKDQIAELTFEVQATILKWVTKHGLEANHFKVVDVQPFYRKDLSEV